MPNYRMERVTEELKKQLSAVIREELRDPAIPVVLSVLAVEASKDMKMAKVHISVLAGEAEAQQALKALQGHAPFLRRQLGRRISLINTPELNFVLDRSIEKGAHISGILKELEKADGLGKEGE